MRSGEGGFEAILDTYLTEGHRDDRGTGCPLAGMGSELARGDQQTREVAHKGFSDLVNVIAANMPDKSQAVFAMAAMVGALTLSRITNLLLFLRLLLFQIRKYSLSFHCKFSDPSSCLGMFFCFYVETHKNGFFVLDE